MIFQLKQVSASVNVCDSISHAYSRVCVALNILPMTIFILKRFRYDVIQHELFRIFVHLCRVTITSLGQLTHCRNQKIRRPRQLMLNDFSASYDADPAILSLFLTSKTGRLKNHHFITSSRQNLQGLVNALVQTGCPVLPMNAESKNNFRAGPEQKLVIAIPQSPFQPPPPIIPVLESPSPPPPFPPPPYSSPIPVIPVTPQPPIPAPIAAVEPDQMGGPSAHHSRGEKSAPMVLTALVACHHEVGKLVDYTAVILVLPMQLFCYYAQQVLRSSVPGLHHASSSHASHASLIIQYCVFVLFPLRLVLTIFPVLFCPCYLFVIPFVLVYYFVSASSWEVQLSLACGGLAWYGMEWYMRVCNWF